MSPLEEAPDAPPEEDRHLSGRDSGTATMMKNTSRMAMAVAAAITRSSLQSGFLIMFQDTYYKSVLRIRIRRIHMFLGLPDPAPLVRETDPDH